MRRFRPFAGTLFEPRGDPTFIGSRGRLSLMDGGDNIINAVRQAHRKAILYKPRCDPRP